MRLILCDEEVEPTWLHLYDGVEAEVIEIPLAFGGPSRMGNPGPVAVSKADGNTLEMRPDGLFVPSVLASTQW